MWARYGTESGNTVMAKSALQEGTECGNPFEHGFGGGAEFQHAGTLKGFLLNRFPFEVSQPWVVWVLLRAENEWQLQNLGFCSRPKKTRAPWAPASDVASHRFASLASLASRPVSGRGGGLGGGSLQWLVRFGRFAG